MKTLLIPLIFVLAFALVNCGDLPPATELPPDLPASDTEVPPTENPLQLGNTLEPTEMSSNPPVEKFVDLAKKDLADRLGIDPSGIKLVKSKEMLWLNAALGCPRPGVFYAQGRVPGFQIWLEADGTEYIYNTDLNGTLILCPELNPHVPNTDNGPTPGVPIR
jgi:hypothetical protein